MMSRWRDWIWIKVGVLSIAILFIDVNWGICLIFYPKKIPLKWMYDRIFTKNLLSFSRSWTLSGNSGNRVLPLHFRGKFYRNYEVRFANFCIRIFCKWWVTGAWFHESRLRIWDWRKSPKYLKFRRVTNRSHTFLYFTAWTLVRSQQFFKFYYKVIQVIFSSIFGILSYLVHQWWSTLRTPNEKKHVFKMIHWRKILVKTPRKKSWQYFKLSHFYFLGWNKKTDSHESKVSWKITR